MARCTAHSCRLRSNTAIRHKQLRPLLTSIWLMTRGTDTLLCASVKYPNQRFLPPPLVGLVCLPRWSPPSHVRISLLVYMYIELGIYVFFCQVRLRSEPPTDGLCRESSRGKTKSIRLSFRGICEIRNLPIVICAVVLRLLGTAFMLILYHPKPFPGSVIIALLFII